MKKQNHFPLSLALLFVLLGFNWAPAQSNCDAAGNAQAANTQVPWRLVPVSYPRWDKLLKPVFTEMQRLFPQPPKGLKLTYDVSPAMNLQAAAPNDIQRYQGRFGAFDIRCTNYSGVQKAEPADATGNWVYFVVNGFDSVLDNYGGGTRLSYLNTDLPLYTAGDIQIRENANGIKSIYFFNENNEQTLAGWYFSASAVLPYRRLSRSEFAQSYRRYWVTQLNSGIKRLEDSLANSTRLIAEVSVQPGMTETDKQKTIQAIRSGDERSKVTIADYKAQIQDCLQRTEAIMKAPDAHSDAVVNSSNELNYEPTPRAGKNGPGKYVYVENQAIFAPPVPRYQPQYIIVALEREDITPAKIAFTKKLEDEFDLNVVRKLVWLPPLAQIPTISNMGSTPGGYTSGRIENNNANEANGVMFAENFADATIGQAPPRWTVSNDTAIVRSNTGAEGNWLALRQTGLFFPDYAVLLLPTAFTLEFDLSWNKDISYYSPDFVFHIGAARYDNTLKRYDRAQVNLNSYTSARMERIALWLDPFGNNNGRYGLQVFDARGGFLLDKADKTPLFFKEKNRVHVKLVRTGSSLAIYFNDTKMLAEAAMGENIRWNFFGFGLTNAPNAAPGDEFYLSNIRLSQ